MNSLRTNASPIASAHRLFDRTAAGLRSGATASSMSELFAELDGLRASRDQDDWRAIVELSSTHPLRELIHEDPMTRRAFDKPRGYAGDAGLLDFIYGLRGLDQVSELGMRIHGFCAGRSTIRAVRHRRDVLAHSIDRASDATMGDARVLSVACGHLREGERSAAVSTDFVREIVGLDADAASLEVPTSTMPGVFTPAHMSVRRLIAGRVELGEFDLAYSAGLYDYLEERVAARLTRTLFDAVRARGRLLFCNFLKSTPDVGFMETFMGWNLIYRSRREIEALLCEIPEAQIADVRYWEDPFRSVGYLEVQKAG